MTTFLEEEISKLMELKLKITIDLSGEKNALWRKRVKNDIRKKLREKNLRINTLIRSSGLTYLEESFPNLCALLKVIEEDY